MHGEKTFSADMKCVVYWPHTGNGCNITVTDGTFQVLCVPLSFLSVPIQTHKITVIKTEALARHHFHSNVCSTGEVISR